MVIDVSLRNGLGLIDNIKEMKESKKITLLRNKLLKIPVKDYEKLLAIIFTLQPEVVIQLCKNYKFVEQVGLLAKKHQDIKLKLIKQSNKKNIQAKNINQ